MIYTCYEMVRDCREGSLEGWSYFVSNYVPVIRKLLDHYDPGGGVDVNRILRALHEPGAGLFQSMDPFPERWFVAELRQRVVALIEAAPPPVEIDLATVSRALGPLTLVEKQAVWFEAMRYETPQAGAMLRAAPETVAKMRLRAADLVRGSVDAWSASLLADNGFALGRDAATSAGADCLPAKTFLDVLDGRATWRGREGLESHTAACWHCIDHFCRLMEVILVLRDNRPLTASDAGHYLAALGIEAPRRPLWRRWAGGA